MSLPIEASTALIQLLSALTSTNNEERSSAEARLNGEWIAKRPDLLLLGLAEQIANAQDVALRAFGAVLLRRIAPKDAPDSKPDDEASVWDRTGAQIQSQVKALILTSLANEQETTVRHKVADLIAEVTQFAEAWPEVRSALIQCCQAPSPSFRESAFRVFGSNPDVLGDSYSDQLRALFQSGLEDADTKVRLAAVQAFSLYLITTTEATRSKLEAIVPALMNVMPPLLEASDSDGLTSALNALSELIEEYPKMFKSMFSSMVTFCIVVIRNRSLDDAARQAALEVLVIFAEGAPGMCRKDPNYVNDIVVECFAMMTDLGDDEDVKEWLSTDDLDEDESNANHAAAEQALDRLARKLGGKTILPPAFQWLPKLIASENWRERHAALMALSSIAEGCEKLMKAELDKVLGMVLPLLGDVHPRVRWAACNAVGQMCTDFLGAIQSKFTAQVLNALTPVLEAPEGRVAAHAAAAFVNFCEDADQESLEPYLDPILQRLHGLLSRPQKYVQEQAITTIATVADAAETKFIKYYSVMMPLLLGVMRSADGEEYKTLRGKAIECATLIALAVGKETLAPQATELINIMGSIQSSVLSSDDPQSLYLTAAWARICKVLGSDFYPYLSAVMPSLLKSAKLKPDFTVIHDEEEKDEFSEQDGWEFFPIKGQQVGIKTSTLEEKNTAVSTLVLYAHEMKEQFLPYVDEIMREIALPGLLFYYHDGVRSSSAKLLPELLNCIKLAHPNDQSILAQAWTPVLSKLLDLLKSEPSMEILGEVYESFYECLEVVGPQLLAPQHMEAFITSTESQIVDYGRRVDARAQDHKAGDVDLEQDEDALYDIELDEELLSQINKTIHVLFKQHKTNFIPYWKRLLIYIHKFSASSDPNCRQWSICIYDDLIEFCGADAWQLKDEFVRPLAAGLSDSASEVRQAAAYGIGCAAQHGGQVFADLVAQSLPSLFTLCAPGEARSEENVYVADNASCSIAKICRFNSSGVNALDEVIDAWILTLPVTHDTDEAPYAYRYLAELIDARHPAIAKHLPHVIDVSASAIEASVIEGQTLSTLIQSIKTLFASLPPGKADELVAALPEPRKSSFTRQF